MTLFHPVVLKLRLCRLLSSSSSISMLIVPSLSNPAKSSRELVSLEAPAAVSLRRNTPLMTLCDGPPSPHSVWPVLFRSFHVRASPMSDKSPPALACVLESVPVCHCACVLKVALADCEPVSSRSPSPTPNAAVVLDNCPSFQSLCVAVDRLATLAITPSGCRYLVYWSATMVPAAWLVYESLLVRLSAS